MRCANGVTKLEVTKAMTQDELKKAEADVAHLRA